MTNVRDKLKDLTDTVQLEAVETLSDLEFNDCSVDTNDPRIRQQQESMVAPVPTPLPKYHTESYMAEGGAKRSAKRVHVSEGSTPQRSKVMKGPDSTVVPHDKPSKAFTTDNVTSSTQISVAVLSNIESTSSRISTRTTNRLRKFMFQENGSNNLTAPSQVISDVVGLSDLGDLTDKDLELD